MRVCEKCRARYRGEPTVCPLDGGKLVELPDPLVGRTIGGRYVIQKRIGAGGMGTVYRATHDVVGRAVAIKFLSPDLAVDATSRQRFLREAKAANRINHEHIIDITDFGQTDDGLVYLVMEFLDGVPLNEEIAKGAMSIQRALNITLQMAQALARAHEFDVVHRDIKPDNIYLLRGYDSDFVKILDFGLAQMKGELRLTATGTVFGTPEYMAPEQARGAPATASVDLYAVGCVLFEMLTSQLPFEGTTPDLILKHMREPPPKPSSRNPEITRDVDALVLRLMSKKPEKRPQNAFALAEEIKSLLDNHGGVPGLTVAPPAMDAAIEGGTLIEDEPSRPGTEHTIATEDAWEARVEIFRSLIGRAHPEGLPPPWLPSAIDELQARIGEVRRIRGELDQLAGTASAREDDARQLRMRIGRALDELGSDETRILKELDTVRPRLEEARRRLGELERPLLRAWADVPAMPLSGPELDRDIVEALRNAGHLASIWIEAERSVSALGRDVAERERERDDLRFQISQLKGRLGTMNAESELDLKDIRDKTSELDSKLREAVDDIVKHAEPVYRHFMSFPDLHAMVIGDGNSSAPT